MNKERHGVKRTVGLDCHPDSFTAAVVLGTTAQDAAVEKVTDQLPLEQIRPWCEKNCTSDDVLVMEASANSFELCSQLRDIGLHVLVLDSTDVGNAKRLSNVNDKISAVKVAKVFLGGVSDEVWVPDPVTRERREVFSAHEEAVKDCTRHTNRIRSFLNEHTLRLKKGMKPGSAGALEYILGLQDWTEAQRTVLQEAFADLRRAMDKRKTMRMLMAADIAASAELLQLMRIFGVSLITAYGLAAVIGDINRFPNPKKLVAYFGLNPRRQQSGNSDKPGPIAKRGRKLLRAKLVQCAQTVMNRRGSPLHEWAWRLAFRKGHRAKQKQKRGPKNIAVTAVARKLVVSVWYFLSGKPFQAKEENSTLRGKLRDLASELGIKHLRTMGVKSYDEFVEEELEKMRIAACNPT